jgi:hypothetical protein
MTSIVSSVQQSSMTKDSLKSAVDQAKSATQTLRGDLKGLGKPDTEAGSQAQSEVDQLSNELDDSVNKAEDAVNNASDMQSTLSAVSVSTDAFSTMVQQVLTTFRELQGLEEQGKNEIKQAFQSSPSCQKLTSGSGSSGSGSSG